MRDLRAVTLPQPHASLVAAGVQTIVTLPRPTDWRGDLLIHAAAWALQNCVAEYRRNQRGWDALGGSPCDNWPRGAVVAVARVAGVEPTKWLQVSGRDFVARAGGWYCNSHWDDDLRDVFVSPDQLPYADFTPGRHALLLDDVRPVHVPDVKGRPGLWTPDPDLTRRVEGAT